MADNNKYPRTYHVPWSPGATSDDKRLSPDWFIKDEWGDYEIVITEKLDGENTCFTNTDVYARSHGAPTRSPWSRNLWDKDGLLWKIKDKIGVDEYFYGENLYGEQEYKRYADITYVYDKLRDIKDDVDSMRDDTFHMSEYLDTIIDDVRKLVPDEDE